MGNLEGSTGPRRVVQSLWSGAAAAVHKLACPRPVSGRVSRNERVTVGDVVVVHAVVIRLRRSPAEGQPEPQAHRNVDTVRRDLPDDKTAGIRRTAAVPRIESRIPGTRR